MSAVYRVGDRLPAVTMQPTALQLFRYSAVTWNGHRIHFDRDWALHEGHRGLVVHSHLHAANALRVLTEGLGPEWAITQVDYRITRPAVAGDTLVATAEITAVADAEQTLHVALNEFNQDDETCLKGTATVRRRSWAA